jgi:hypothetical protein
VCLYTDFTTCVLVQKEKSPPKAAAAGPPAAAPAAPAAAGKAGELEEKILAQVGNPSSSYFTGNDINNRALYCSYDGYGSELIITVRVKALGSDNLEVSRRFNFFFVKNRQI